MAMALDPVTPDTIYAGTDGSSLKGGVFRVRIRKGTGGLSETSEAACEQIVHVPKENFVPDRQGRVLPLGACLDDAEIEDVVTAVIRVISP